MRREPVLREARQWFVRDFTPESIDELSTVISGERNASFRMVVGYWDMACSMVTFGAIDREMFRAANPEMLATYSKVHPFLTAMREGSGTPEFLQHMEGVVMATPGIEQRLERLRSQFIGMKQATRSAE